MTRRIVRAVVAELPDAWRSATTVCGGIALAVVVLAALYATQPLGLLLLRLAQGGH